MRQIRRPTRPHTNPAVANALVDNQTMTGADNHRVEALPHDRLREVLKKYNRVKE